MEGGVGEHSQKKSIKQSKSRLNRVDTLHQLSRAGHDCLIMLIVLFQCDQTHIARFHSPSSNACNDNVVIPSVGAELSGIAAKSLLLASHVAEHCLFDGVCNGLALEHNG